MRISEADWKLAQEKRKANSYKREKVHDIDHAHILSGLLKWPCCGKSLYGNIVKAHSKDKYTRYYYYCKNTLGVTGHKCTFRINIEQTEMNRMELKLVMGTKTRLKHQMDNMDISDPYYDKKISDLQRRYDEQYDKA